MTPHSRPPRLPTPWRALLSVDDATIVDAGAAGERLVARIRLVLCGILLFIPLSSVLNEPVEENFVGLATTLVSLALAAGICVLANGHRPRRWLALVSSTIDVTMVSAPLCVFLVLGAPHTAVNSRVIFEVYFLAIGATCLRYDLRVCAYAGALAIVQYLGITLYAATQWDLNSAAFAPFAYGMFSWSTQISRLILLATATLLSASIVRRAYRLRQLSTLDRLTGVMNRGAFDDRAGQELSRAQRYGHPVTVAVIDVDEFKGFNDSFGHAAGDDALRSLTATLRQSLRRSDIVARYGGEEFVVLMPETPAESGVEKLEAIRRLVSELEVSVPRRDDRARFTISVGVASWPDDVRDVEALLPCADERLYAAKRAGRNRVTGPPFAAATAAIQARSA
ncbi:MAG: diguanylate cyclase [Gemmatimonadaceae bacterium]